MDVGIIYKITNTISGRAYVGQTVMPLMRRWSHHCSTAIHRPTGNNLYTDIKNIGCEKFVIETLCENIPRQDLSRIEQEQITLHCTQIPNGYNIQKGGGTYINTTRTRRKISESLKGCPQHPNSGMKGRSHTDETKQKMSKSQIGREFSELSKQRMCASKPKALTADEVCSIRQRVTLGEKQCDIACEYGVSKQTICNVVNKKRCYSKIGN